MDRTLMAALTALLLASPALGQDSLAVNAPPEQGEGEGDPAGGETSSLEELRADYDARFADYDAKFLDYDLRLEALERQLAVGDKPSPDTADGGATAAPDEATPAAQ